MTKLFMLFLYLLFLVTISLSTENVISSDCEAGDCLAQSGKCDEKCGCIDTALIMSYNETLGECVINFKRILQNLNQKYNTQEKIREEVESTFQGIIISVIIFITCAGLGFIGACVYCCRIGYTDNKLKKDVDALANKLKRDGRWKKSLPKSKQEPASESCNIIVEEAGVYVV